MSLSIIAALTRVTSRWSDAPRIITVSRRPAGGLLEHFFGADRAFNLVLTDDGGATLTSAMRDAALTTFADPATAVDAIVADGGVILRFIDLHTIRVVDRDLPDLIAAARCIWLQLADPDQQNAGRAMLQSSGFVHALASVRPPGELLAREPLRFDAPPDHQLTRARTMDTLVLIDNNMSDARGHYLPIACRIAHGAQQAGVNMVWAVDERISASVVPKNVERASVFRASIFDIPREDQSQISLSSAIAAGLRQVFATHDSPTTHFLMPTTDAHHVRALHGLLRDGFRPTGPIHLSTPYETRHMSSRHVGREVDWYLRDLLGDSRANIMLWAETDALGRLMQDRLDVRVPTLPLPVAGWAQDLPPATLGGPLTIAFLGEARLDKGFMELPAITAAIMRAAAMPGDIRLIIQATPPYGGFTPDMAAVVETLRATDGIELIEEVLSDAAYRGLIRDAHCILLPYRVDNYAFRGSGILFEALAAGRTILATAGTVAESYADDGQVLLADEPDDWTGIVSRVLADRTRYSRDASRAGKRFARRHAPRAYIDRLAFRVEFSASPPVAL